MSQTPANSFEAFYPACLVRAQLASLQPIPGYGGSPFLTNPFIACRMTSTLGKRRAAVFSNDLEVDFKEQTSNRRKPDEEHLTGEKTKATPILNTSVSKA